LIILMVARVHVALILRLKYKNMGAPLLVFAGIWYDIYIIIFWLPSDKCEIVSWKKKSLKTSKISLFSFRLYFVIVGVNLPCTIYYYNYMWYCFKKKTRAEQQRTHHVNADQKARSKACSSRRRFL
jgi:hypothetical protein